MIREIQPGESITWPGNKRLALLIAIHFEADSASYIRPDGSVDTQDLTNRQYGGKIGIWRLLRILDRHDIKCTFFICGAAADSYPDAARAIAQRGHDIAGHGYYHEALWRLTRDAEEEVFTKTLGTLERATGRRPLGSRSCAASPTTLHTAAKMGLAWDSSMWNDDYPYLLDLGGGRTLVEIPFTINNDINFMGGGITPPAYVQGRFRSAKYSLEAWKSEFDACLIDPSGKPKMMTFCVHDYMTGHASNSKSFDDFIQYAKGDNRVWIATYSEMADRWRELCRNSTHSIDNFSIATNASPA